MTPLSEALTAAQRSALAALEKAYVARQIEPDEFAERLAAAGITDTLDLAAGSPSTWSVCVRVATSTAPETTQERLSGT